MSVEYPINCIKCGTPFYKNIPTAFGLCHECESLPTTKTNYIPTKEENQKAFTWNIKQARQHLESSLKMYEGNQSYVEGSLKNALTWTKKALRLWRISYPERS